jgi:hypothetical protein
MGCHTGCIRDSCSEAKVPHADPRFNEKEGVKTMKQAKVSYLERAEPAEITPTT